MSTENNEVTTILEAIREGTPRASDRLLPVVYDQLRRLAQQMMGAERPGQTLQATALVHEAYLRLIGDEPTTWEDRRHFYGAAALAMRRILIERARRRGRVKHGGGRARLELDDDDAAIDDDAIDVLALDEVLSRLQVEDARAAQVVMLRFFAGLGIEDTAQTLDIAPRTVRRDWMFAKTWLYDALGGEDQP